MELVIPVDSVIVSGITMLLFNVFFFSAIQRLCQSISSSTNLHILYDRRHPLTPRTSRIGLFFGGPIGHLPISRILSVAIVLYAAALIPLDFSINGSSRDEYIPTVYRSLVQAHPQKRPMQINYAEEFKSENGITYASTRLVAVAEIHGCMFLDFSHHRLFAYAYRDDELDTSLIPIKEEINGGECITKDNFRNENLMHMWGQTEYDEAKCEMSDVRVIMENGMKNSIVSAKIEPKNEATCEINFLTVKCFKTETDNCVAIAEKKGQSAVGFVLAIVNSKDPGSFDRHELRKLSNMGRDDRDKFASNIAYFLAVGFPQGVHNFMYMAVADVKYNVTLHRLKRMNTSVINLPVSIPAMIIIIVVLSGLTIIAVVVRYQFVHRRNRQNYNKFSSVEDILVMVQDQGLTKMRGASAKPYILYQENRPVISRWI